MGFTEVIREQIPDHIMLPACGQGALAIECRTDDQETQTLVAGLNDPTSAICVHAERQVNALLGGNCHVPLAVFCAPIAANQLMLRAKILNEDGTHILSNQQTGSPEDAPQLAIRCSQELLAQGGAELLASAPK